MTIEKIRTKILNYVKLKGKYPTHIKLNNYQFKEIMPYIKEDKTKIYNLEIFIESGKIEVF